MTAITGFLQKVWMCHMLHNIAWRSIGNIGCLTAVMIYVNQAIWHKQSFNGYKKMVFIETVKLESLEHAKQAFLKPTTRS